MHAFKHLHTHTYTHTHTRTHCALPPGAKRWASGKQPPNGERPQRTAKKPLGHPTTVWGRGATSQRGRDSDRATRHDDRDPALPGPDRPGSHLPGTEPRVPTGGASRVVKRVTSPAIVLAPGMCPCPRPASWTSGEEPVTAPPAGPMRGPKPDLVPTPH